MARRQVSVYSIERARLSRNGDGAAHDDADAADRHDQLMTAIAEIRTRLENGPADAAASQEDGSAVVSEEFLAEYKAGLEQVTSLKSELIHIEAAIERTKREIAGLHESGIKADTLNGVTDELDAVVSGTERATERILEAAEEIEQNARNLSAALQREGDQNMALEIQEHATKIFEACNFQDLTGQRISKVVNTMRYVEERVLKMIEIWGGLDAFRDVAAAPMPNPAGPDDMLHGPGDIDNDPARATQDDIDALFD